MAETPDMDDGQIINLTPEELEALQKGEPINPKIIGREDADPEQVRAILMGQEEQYLARLAKQQAAASEPQTPEPEPEPAPKSEPEPESTQLADLLPKMAELLKAHQAPDPSPPKDAKPDETPQPKPEPDADKTAPPALCPNCAWNPEITPAAVSDADKKDFLRAMLGQQPFVKTFAFGGGAMSVRFRTRNMATNQMIQRQLAQEHRDGRLPRAEVGNIGYTTHVNRTYRLQLAASLVSVGGVTEALPEIPSEEAVRRYGDSDDRDTVVAKAHDALFGTWSEPLYAALFKQFIFFEQVSTRLMEAMNSPDFFNGTDG